MKITIENVREGDDFNTALRRAMKENPESVRYGSDGKGDDVPSQTWLQRMAAPCGWTHYDPSNGYVADPKKPLWRAWLEISWFWLIAMPALLIVAITMFALMLTGVIE